MVSHVDEEDLALMALGEPAGAGDEEHLSTCAHCQSRLDQLVAVVATSRSIEADDHPAAPPDEVWQAISAELAQDGKVVVLDERRERRRPRAWLLAGAAAVIGLLAGAGLVTAVNSTPSDVVVATAVLDPLEGTGQPGRATVARNGNDAVLTVEVPGLATPDDGYYEVWMATPDTTTMVALGTLNPGTTGTFALPAGMDPSAFPVVDVSLEHFDGDASHSATSIVRGQLAT